MKMKFQIENYVFRIRTTFSCFLLKRNVNLNISKQYCDVKYTNSTILSNLTDCSTEYADNTIDNTPHIKDIEESKFFKIYNLINGYGFKKKEMVKNLAIFGVHPLTLKNRFMVLEEGGCNFKKIELNSIYRFIPLSKKSIGDLKRHGIIKKVDVIETMASFVNMPDSIIPKFCESDVDSKSFIQIQEIVAKVFIMWRLNISSDKLDIGIKRYPRISHKSLRYMQETLDLLRNEIGFTEEKIRSQIYLLHTDAENTRALLQLDQIGGYKPVDILKVYPKIMTYPLENILKINQIFKEYNFPLTSVSKVMDIYTLSPESIRERLDLIQRVPQFNLLIDHPSILKLALYQKKVKHRLKVLEDHKMKNISIHLLFANDNVFNKYIEEGADRTRGDDSLYFLCKELLVDKKNLRATLNRHPYWYHVSALVISENLKYLYSKNFTKEEILKSIFVLLYPKSVIEKELLYLKNQPGIETCLTADKKEIRKETVLPLVLYFMEQPHNFSGAGIWTNQKLPQI